MKVPYDNVDSGPALRDLHIASCVARAVPERMSAVIDDLATCSNVQVYAHDHTKIILVLEGDSTANLLDQVDALRWIKGVINVELVYQHAEDEVSMKERITCQ